MKSPRKTAKRDRRSVWTAITVPTFKMRIAQTFVVVLVIVASLIIVGTVILARGLRARHRSEAAMKVTAAADNVSEGTESQSRALVSIGVGDIEEARSSFVEFRDLGESALQSLRSAGELAAEEADRWEELLLEATGIFEGALESYSQGSTAELDGLMVDWSRSLATQEEFMEGSRSLASELVQESIDQQKNSLRLGIVGYSIIIIATMILGALTMTTAYRGLSRLIRKAIDEVKEIARGKGDLTAKVTVPTPDIIGELADAINDLVSSLRGSMLEIRSIATTLNGSAEALASSIEEMTSSVEEITSAVEQISVGSEDQARKVDGTSGAMGEVSRSIEGINEKVQLTSEQTSITAELVKQGDDAAEESVRVMREISDSVMESERLMKGLEERFTQIGIIVDVITDIADQTNLLALNAAIEAARAGEQGKGFAVVAGQVRDLAENSKRSAEQISSLIREIVAETRDVTESMEEGTNRVESGLRVADNTGEALHGILVSSEKAADAATEISRSIQAIARNIDQVFASTNDIAAIAQETAASTEQVAATMNEQRASTEDVARASMELARLASKLHEVTGGFKL